MKRPVYFTVHHTLWNILYISQYTTHYETPCIFHSTPHYETPCIFHSTPHYETPCIFHNTPHIMKRPLYFTVHNTLWNALYISQYTTHYETPCVFHSTPYIMKRPVYFTVHHTLWNALYISQYTTHYETPCVFHSTPHIMKRPVYFTVHHTLWNALYISQYITHYETPCIFHSTSHIMKRPVYFTVHHTLIPGTILTFPRNDAWFPALVSAVLHNCIHTLPYYATRRINKQKSTTGETSNIIVQLHGEETSTYLMKHRYLVMMQFSWNVRPSLSTSIVLEVSAPHSSDCDEASWNVMSCRVVSCRVVSCRLIHWKCEMADSTLIRTVGEICQILQAKPPHRTSCFKFYVIRQSPIYLASAAL